MPRPDTVAVLKVTIESNYDTETFDKLYKVEATELADETESVYALFEYRSGGYGYLETLGATEDLFEVKAVQLADEYVRDYAALDGAVQAVETLDR